MCHELPNYSAAQKMEITFRNGGYRGDPARSIKSSRFYARARKKKRAITPKIYNLRKKAPEG